MDYGLEPAKTGQIELENKIFEPICKAWLGIVDNVKTKILRSSDDVFIPELSLQA